MEEEHSIWATVNWNSSNWCMGLWNLFLVFKVIDSTVGLRVTAEEEIAGLDALNMAPLHGDFYYKKIIKAENQLTLSLRFPPF